MKMWRYDLIPDGGWEEYGHAPGEPGGSYEAEVALPEDAQILTVALSSKGVSLYALTEGIEGAPARRRSFVVVGNDAELPDGIDAMHYRGTAKVLGGPTAHVFETTKVEVPQP